MRMLRTHHVDMEELFLGKNLGLGVCHDQKRDDELGKRAGEQVWQRQEVWNICYLVVCVQEGSDGIRDEEFPKD